MNQVTVEVGAPLQIATIAHPAQRIEIAAALGLCWKNLRTNDCQHDEC